MDNLSKIINEMKINNENRKKLLTEAGVAIKKYGYCPECSKKDGYRPEIIPPWINRVAKCSKCGSALFEKGDIAGDVIDSLKNEITKLENDPETAKGESLADEININGMSENEAFQKHNVTPEEAKRCMDKFALLAAKKSKLKRLTKAPSKTKETEED